MQAVLFSSRPKAAVRNRATPLREPRCGKPQPGAKRLVSGYTRLTLMLCATRPLPFALVLDRLSSATSKLLPRGGEIDTVLVIFEMIETAIRHTSLSGTYNKICPSRRHTTSSLPVSSACAVQSLAVCPNPPLPRSASTPHAPLAPRPALSPTRLEPQISSVRIIGRDATGIETTYVQMSEL